SVLENHHASLAFQLTLGKSELNIFENLPRDEYVAIRRSVVDMVLATDMFRHYDYLEQFQRTILADLVHFFIVFFSSFL
uniref:PDEase domain-containing protein n=1 Tax=Romanomermis culicivorax TaxID=13658 RepID=A0A915JM54_ROMCU